MAIVARKFLSVVAAVSAVLLLCSCTIRHAVQADYPQYLAKNAGVNLPKTDKASQYRLTPHTQDYKYEFRAFTTGVGNLWIVEFGKMLDDTLRSADVQAAFGPLKKVSDADGGAAGTLTFDLQRYAFEQFGAHVSLKISFSKAGRTVFEKVYDQAGETQGGKMFFGGAFAQKNAVQQSTKLALDAILRRLIEDLNASAVARPGVPLEDPAAWAVSQQPARG